MSQKSEPGRIAAQDPRPYEIVATLGPSSAQEPIWQAMIAAGTTAFRLNTSHLTLEQLDGWLARIDRFYRSAGVRLPLVLDLQGSKWRLGQFEPFELVEGELVELVFGEISGQRGIVPVPHADFFKAAPLSDGELVLNDAKIRLRVENAGQTSVRAQILQGGWISARKGITYNASDFRVETISEKDQAILERAARWQPIRLAVSYVKDALEMEKYRARLGPAAYLVAKLERGPALADAAGIAALSNELWLCRGDLGAELGLKAMAQAVARFTQQVGRFAVPTLMAGQVLEHMTEQPMPTRSEVCYLYDTLAAGYHGFVLSDEAAVGRYPVESCRAAALFKN